MTAERGADASLLAERKIIALPDIVEAEKLHHQVMGGVAPGFNERNRVMAGIGVEEIGVEGPQHVVGQLKPEHVTIERQRVIDVLDVQHRMAHAERPGTEARERAPGLERLACRFGAMEDFKPIAERIGEHDQILHAALVRQRPRPG